MLDNGLFQRAMQALQRNDRPQAYRLMCQVLRENPRDAAAWIVMSRLVDDLAQQRDCLERALKLAPDSHEARDALENVRIREVLTSARSIVVPEIRTVPRKLGAYLVEQGVITPAQLQAALAEQRATQTACHRTALGDIFIQHRWVTPQQLAKALIAQQHDRLHASHTPVPERLGDYLVLHRLMTPEQLERALAIQMELHHLGRRTRLGELLIELGYLSRTTIDQMLEQQRQAFFNAMNAAM